MAPPAWFSLPAALLAYWHGIPCVLDLGDSAISQARGISRLWHLVAERLLRRLSCAVVVASPDLAKNQDQTVITGIGEEFFRIGERRLTDGNWEGNPSPQVVYCGTFGELQTLDHLLEVLADLIGKLPGIRLTLIGRGCHGEENKLRALVARLGLQANVTVEEQLAPNEIPQRLARADWGLVTLSDRPELHYAIPTKILEYLAAALPVLAIGGERMRKILATSEGGVWLAPREVYSSHGGELLASVLAGPRRQFAERGFAYARSHLTKAAYQAEMNTILLRHARRWSPTVERALVWLEKKCLVGRPYLPAGRLAVRHSIPPSRIPQADRWAYPEASAYAAMLYLELYRLDPKPIFLERAKALATWVANSQTPSGGVPFVYDLLERKFKGPCYAFDTGMAVRAWLMLARTMCDTTLKDAAGRAGRWLIGRMQAEDGFFRAAERIDNGGDLALPVPSCHYGDGGALHLKLALPLADLIRAFPEEEAYATARRRLLDWGLRLPLPEGAYPIGQGTREVFIHTHCYALEGLIGVVEALDVWHRGLLWSARYVREDGLMPQTVSYRHCGPPAIDASAQTLRLLALMVRERTENEIILHTAERMARALRRAQRRDGSWPEFVKKQERRGPPVWPALLAISALLFWEREELEADWIF